MAIRKGAPHVGARWFNEDGTPTQEVFTFLTRGPFVSQPQAITNGATLTLTHGLGVTPSRVTVTIRNITSGAVLGIAANREVQVSAYEDATPGDYGIGISYNATDVNVTVGATGIRIVRESAPIGELAAITNADWRMIVRADA